MEIGAKFSADVGGCMRQGWEIYKRQPLMLSGATVLMMVLMSIAAAIPFGSLLVVGPLIGGLYLLIIRIDRGEDLSLAHYFDAFRLFVPLLIASLLTTLFIAVGYLLLIIPGLYLTLAYAFTTLNIVDGGCDFWPAMEQSRRDVTRHFLDYLLLFIVIFCIAALAAIPFGLGLIVAVPVCLAAQYCFYRDMNAFYADSPVN